MVRTGSLQVAVEKKMASAPPSAGAAVDRRLGKSHQTRQSRGKKEGGDWLGQGLGLIGALMRKSPCVQVGFTIELRPKNNIEIPASLVFTKAIMLSWTQPSKK